MPWRHIGQDEDVEGQGLRLKDADGNEWVIASDRVTAIAWTDASGEQHDVEGHTIRGRLDAEPEVEGHYYRKFEQEPEVQGHMCTVKYRDDDGKEQEVEGHAFRGSWMSDEPEVEGHLIKHNLSNEPDVEGHGYRVTGK